MNGHNLRPTNRLADQHKAHNIIDDDTEQIVDDMLHFINDTACKINTLQRNSNFNQLQIMMKTENIENITQEQDTLCHNQVNPVKNINKFEALYLMICSLNRKIKATQSTFMQNLLYYSYFCNAQQNSVKQKQCNKNYLTLQARYQLRKITEKDEQHDDLQGSFSFQQSPSKLKDSNIYASKFHQSAQLKKFQVNKGKGIIFPIKIWLSGRQSFVKTLKIKTQFNQKPYIFFRQDRKQEPKQRIQPLQKPEQISKQLFDINFNNFIAETSKPQQTRLVRSSFLFGKQTNIKQARESEQNKRRDKFQQSTLPSGSTLISLKNSGVTNAVTIFGSQAVNFKNSLVKERESFKVQNTDRKSLPVRPLIKQIQLIEAQDQNKSERKKIKIRNRIMDDNMSKYQRSEGYLICSGVSCVEFCQSSQTQFQKQKFSHQNSSNLSKSNLAKTQNQGQSTILDDQCSLSYQIKDSIASTNTAGTMTKTEAHRKTSQTETYLQDRYLPPYQIYPQQNSFVKQKANSFATANITPTYSIMRDEKQKKQNQQCLSTSGEIKMLKGIENNTLCRTIKQQKVQIEPRQNLHRVVPGCVDLEHLQELQDKLKQKYIGVNKNKIKQKQKHVVTIKANPIDSYIANKK